MSHSIKVKVMRSLVQFDYEKAVSNYLGTQSTFNPSFDRDRWKNLTVESTEGVSQKKFHGNFRAGLPRNLG